jgi:hypothetical protein
MQQPRLPYPPLPPLILPLSLPPRSIQGLGLGPDLAVLGFTWKCAQSCVQLTRHSPAWMARLHVGRYTARGRFALILLPAEPRPSGRPAGRPVFRSFLPPCTARRYRSLVDFHDPRVSTAMHPTSTNGGSLDRRPCSGDFRARGIGKFAGPTGRLRKLASRLALD